MTRVTEIRRWGKRQSLQRGHPDPFVAGVGFRVERGSSIPVIDLEEETLTLCGCHDFFYLL